MFRPASARAALAALLTALSAGGASSQESSIVTLEAPAGGEGAEAGEGGAADPQSPCGTKPITIARMQWPSSALMAEIHARILVDNFGCRVEVQESDMATVGSSMGSNGQPAVAPEMWVARIPDIWNAAVEAQKVRQAGASYQEPVFEGWFVPAYVADTWSDIASVEGLKAHAGEMGSGGRPRFITCPADWGCNVVNRNMLRAQGLEGLFEVVEPANRFELDTLIAEAVGRQEPIVFYYWQPNAILAQFSFREVELGTYNRDNFLCLGRLACASPLPTGFAPDPVIAAVSEWVYVEAPQVASYFQRAKMPFAEMNAMLQQLTEAGASVETVTERFIAERGEVWRPWAGLPL
jgi:glycine betaine/proline transport system substrate-binding protein